MCPTRTVQAVMVGICVLLMKGTKTMRFSHSGPIAVMVEVVLSRQCDGLVCLGYYQSITSRGRTRESN